MSRLREFITSCVINGILISVSFAAVFPLIWLVRTSFGTRVISISSPPIWFFTPTLENYIKVVHSDFPRYLLNSAIVVTATVAVVMILGSFAGYALARFSIRGSESWFFYMLTTRMGPPVAFALPYYIVYQTLGLYDTFLGLIIIYSAVNLAFSVWLTRSFFEDLPVSLEEAAMVDGLSRMQAFHKITLPLAAPGLAATAVFVFILSWNEFFYASVLTQNLTRTFTTQLPTFITFQRIYWEEMAAAACIGIIPVLFFALLVRRNLVRGFTFGQVR